MTSTFAELGLPEPLVRSLTNHKFTEAFPIQAATIPDALAGRDVSGKAPTGSGKTLAFGLPMLAKVPQASPHRPTGLILAPTRELAQQIRHELSPLAGSCHRRITAVYGGVRYGPQKNALAKGVDILVATPGRLQDLIDQGAVALSAVTFVVVDEADRMADMGFLPDVRRLLDGTSPDRQTLLFSATLDGAIATLSKAYQNQPVRHESGTVETTTDDATHFFWQVAHDDRVQHAADVVNASGRSIVFTRTRHGADRLARQLTKLGVGAVALHGGRSQNQRNRALKAFSTGEAQALVATDVAARGIHVDAVASVVHYDIPGDSKDYVHRSGRTARAGASGNVVSFVTREQQRSVKRMQKDLNIRVAIGEPRLGALMGGSLPRSSAAAVKQERPAAQPRTERPARPAPTPESRAKGAVASRGTQGPKRPRSTRDGESANGAARSIKVTNLPWNTTTDQLRGLFAQFGMVHEATVITNRRTGRSKGFGFVDMPAPEASAAVASLHGSSLDGRDIAVHFTTPKKARA
jgi:superfamily II DNA/RNA helicase